MKRRSQFILGFAVAVITSFTLHATVGHRHHNGREHGCYHENYNHGHCDDDMNKQEQGIQ